jgi:hypothetical protein
VELVYLAGAPATGKSTLMAELTRGARRESRETIRLLPYDELWVGNDLIGAELGRRRADFPGTDTLAMNVLPVASDWLGKKILDVVCAEGDRLTHIRFLDAAARNGYRVNLFLLTARMSVLDARCEARGSKQARSWRLGRVTLGERVAAAAEESGYRVYRLDAEKPTAELADFVRGKVPVLEQLKLKVKTEARTGI